MIPISEVVPENLYSQDDALFLLGSGFTKRAAKELLCEVCRKGELSHSYFRKRYWFTGREFLEWVAKWFGREITKGFAFQKSSHHNGGDDNGLGAAHGESDESLQAPR